MWAINKKSGFTIVELLIVIVVIGILAAITLVAYNGVLERAKASSMAADFSNNNKVAKIVSAYTGNLPTTLDVLQGSSKMAASKGVYKLLSFCATTQSYVLAAETTTGNKYYSLNGTASVQDNSIDVTDACQSLGIALADKIYLGMPSTSCAVEGGNCSFTGTASIAYGSLAVGKFAAKTNLTSPVTCSNAFFGDPASGFAKACYVLGY